MEYVCEWMNGKKIGVREGIETGGVLHLQIGQRYGNICEGGKTEREAQEGRNSIITGGEERGNIGVGGTAIIDGLKQGI